MDLLRAIKENNNYNFVVLYFIKMAWLLRYGYSYGELLGKMKKSIDAEWRHNTKL